MYLIFRHRVRGFCLIAGATLCLIAQGSAVSHGQSPIFSFEDGLQSWTSPDGVTLTQSSFGATDGNNALLLDNLSSGYKNETATTPNFGPSTPGLSDAFNAFNLAAAVIANGGTPKLEFDLTWDFSQGISGFIQLGMFINSSTAGGGGFKALGTGNLINGNSGFASWPALGTNAVNDGAILTVTSPTSAHVAIPFGPTKTLTLSSESTFFDIGFRTNGDWGGTVDIAVDNILFTGVPIFEEHTLFSWETPDNPGTPGVNEQFEGWVSAQTPVTQNLSVVSTGATDGTHALQVDRTPLQDGFTWGSSFALNSDIDPDPMVETIDPVIQAEIDDFVTRINGASRVAIDVTFIDQFPATSPSFTSLSLAFTDETGAYYQANLGSFDIADAATETMTTLILDIAAFDDFNSDKNLAVDGLEVGTNAFGIVLGTNSDDGSIFQIDNFRLISEVTSVSGDFDEDGDVDGNDFLVWQRGGSPNGINSGDLALWQAQYGGAPPVVANTAVPEPSALLLTLGTFAIFMTCGRRE